VLEDGEGLLVPDVALQIVEHTACEAAYRLAAAEASGRYVGCITHRQPGNVQAQDPQRHADPAREPARTAGLAGVSLAHLSQYGRDLRARLRLSLHPLSQG